MIRELIVPNLHVILIHYPLGVFFAGLLIELGSFMWRRSSVRTAGRWMLLIGALSMIPTALTGVYALHDAALIGNGSPTEHWREVAAASPLTAQQWHEVIVHTWLMSIATALVVLAVIAYLAFSDRLRHKLYWPTLLLLVIGAGTMAAGAWYAGEAVYKSGVAVEGPEEQPTTQEADNDHDAIARAKRQPGTRESVAEATGAEPQTLVDKIDIILPPAQPHVIMAGISVAIALAAVGVSIRKITGDVPPPQLADADALVQSLNPPEPPPAVYPGRLWMTAMVFFILTALGGWYVFGSDAGTFNPKQMWADVSNKEANPAGPVTRGVAHVIAATALIFLPLIMAGLARWAPRQKALLGVCTLLLVLMIAVQVWIGMLLLFDGSEGVLTRFN